MLPERYSNTYNFLTEGMIVEIITPKARPKSGSAMRSRQDNIITKTTDLINAFAPMYELNRVTNLSRFIGQVAIESDYFRTTTEYASGKAYETRTDLGNTAAYDGDGPLFKGHGLIQTTGRDNHENFNEWAHKDLAGFIKSPIPDFVKEPHKLSEFPWAFFSATYFWALGNRTGQSLNRYAQQNNDEMITRIINGALTHFDRRLEMTSNAGLVLLGYPVSNDGIKGFQSDKKLKLIDGIIGKSTRDALHEALQAEDARVAARPLPLPKPVIISEPVPAPVPAPAAKEEHWLTKLLTLLFGRRG